MATLYFPRELRRLDVSEEEGVFDVAAFDGAAWRYSPDVYDNEQQALQAIAAFVAEGEDVGDWEETHHPGIDTDGQYIDGGA